MQPRTVFRGGSTLGLAIVCLVAAGLPSSAQTEEVVQPPSELKKLSLDELFEMEVTSVSKRPEKLSETAAAIHVVTDEDIRRSGALSIPEALRDVPGVEVARVDTREYAITARGFNGTAANKLLVLMDGRSVYTPLFSGVFWDVQDTFMEDLARIEVIRGPGATLWGANAVNGVINVISKSSEDTQGLLITGGGGHEERGFAGIRYGGRLASNAFIRVYGKSFDRDDSVLPNGSAAEDRFRMTQGGFRVDWRPSTEDLVTLQGDTYTGRAGQPRADDVDLWGGNVLGRWTRELSAGSSLQFQVYYDHTKRDIPPLFGESLDTHDADLQHRFPLGARQDVVWGLAYRLTHDDVENTPILAFLPARLTHHLYTGFVQDELKLAGGRLRLALGSKFEHNDYTGFEYQPSLRLAWMPTLDHTLWAAASRVVRTPSRIDRDFFVPGTPPFVFLAGGRDFQSEVLHAFELGYKALAASRLTASVATFYDSYDKLRSLEMGPPAFIANGVEGAVYGAEVEATCQVLPGWRLDAGTTFQHLRLRTKPGSTDTTQENQEGDSPRHQLYLKSWIDLPFNVQLDLTARYVDRLPHQEVPAYTAFDLRVAWKRGEKLELAVIARDLFDPHHPEFGMPATRREIQRSVYAKGTWRF